MARSKCHNLPLKCAIGRCGMPGIHAPWYQKFGSSSNVSPPNFAHAAAILLLLQILPVDHEEAGHGRTFVMTGDIDDMWIRDSAAQFHPYLPMVDQRPDLKEAVLGTEDSPAHCQISLLSSCPAQWPPPFSLASFSPFRSNPQASLLH